MRAMNDSLLQLDDPTDYFRGRGHAHLPTPRHILAFLRTEKKTLQQEALQNRSHHRFVLCINLKTAGHIHLDHLTLPFAPGQALLILPYQFHHFSLGAATTLQWLFCTFELNPRTFLEPLRNRTIPMSPTTVRAVEAFLQEWHRPPGELQDAQQQTLLLRALIALKQDRQDGANDLPPEPADTLMRTINRLLAEWRGRMVVVADLARQLGCSESRLRVRFKAVAGIPLGAYLQNYRINRAMALLRTSPLSIADIAREAGFGSPQAFSRAFKNETEQTPRAYRNRI